MTEYEYTIERGWDAHTHMAYDPDVYSTPEAALTAAGASFHPDADCVVRREVGSTVWGYWEEDQTYDRATKLAEYREAYLERKRVEALYAPAKSSALPGNRRVKTSGPFVSAAEGVSIWYLTAGSYDIPKMLAERERGR